MQRRSFLAQAGLAAAGTLVARAAQAEPVRRLSFVNTHTGERLAATYFENGHFEPEALRDIDRVLRDHRNGEIKPIDDVRSSADYRRAVTARVFHRLIREAGGW